MLQYLYAGIVLSRIIYFYCRQVEKWPSCDLDLAVVILTYKILSRLPGYMS